MKEGQDHLATFHNGFFFVFRVTWTALPPSVLPNARTTDSSDSLPAGVFFLVAMASFAKRNRAWSLPRESSTTLSASFSLVCEVTLTTHRQGRRVIPLHV